MRDERFAEAAQDVHDVLGRHSSERPREDDEVVGGARDLDRPRGGRRVGDAAAKPGGQARARPRDRRLVGIEREDARCLFGDAEREAAVTAADLEHARAREVGDAPQRGEVRAFRVEDASS